LCLRYTLHDCWISINTYILLMNLRKLLFSFGLPVLLLLTLSLAAQDRVVTGKVTDATGRGVAGVSVTVRGQSAGTTTNDDGTYSIRTSENATLVFSSIGFTTQEVPLNGRASVSVAMQSSAGNLNEVVVVGYGTQRRREVTGAISKVTSDQVNSIAAPSFEASLQGKAPGVQVIQGSGLAGSGSVIRIRGINSISAGGDPLYVIDGIPVIADNFIRSNGGGMNQNPLATINPNDIESIEVLKDAAAAGIYGSRGSNGVILITTKRGRAGQMNFNYNNKIGISTYANRPEFLNNQEWLQLRQEAWENDGNTGQAPLPGGVTWADAQNTNTDWWKELTRTGVINEHSLSMNTGGKMVKAYVGTTYSNNQSYLKNNAFVRAGIRTNLDFIFTSNFKASLNAAFNNGVNKRVPAAWDGGLGDAMSYALPIYPIYKSDGSYFTGGANPVRRLNETTLRNTDRRLLGGIALDYAPTKNLTLRATGSYDYLRGTEDRFETANWLGRTDVEGQAQRGVLVGRNWVVNGTATYAWDMNEKSKFKFMVGTEFQEKWFVNTTNAAGAGNIKYFTGKPFYQDKDTYKRVFDSLNAAGAITKTEYNPETFTSFFTRLNYALSDKYFIQLLARVDGSSKFGPKNKYGFFPSASIGWVLSEESFLKGVSFINFLKFRASYGLTGNSNITSNRYTANYNNTGTYNGNPAIALDNIGDPYLHWENQKNFDAGFEFSLLKSKLTGEVSYYNKRSYDLLLRAGLSPSIGYEFQERNIDNSEILNEGIELSLNYRIIDKNDWKLSLGGNISRNYNELVSLGSLSPDAAGGGTNDTRVAVGYPIGTNYLVRYYGVDPTDGLPIWYDLSGKLTKTFSLQNRMPVGSVVPEFVGGINHALAYKGFELTSLWTFVIGGNLYDGSAKRQAGVVTDWNMRRDILDRWQKPGDVTKYPRLTMNTNVYDGLSSEWQYNSTMFLYDASFMRLREISLGYRISAATASRLHLKGARIFVTGMNLLTFSKYPGGDPEIARDFENPQDRNLSPNITYLTPPQQKTVVVGININF
jgi:TonB-dependent starch-binding outer membrane protein SusC